jgi:predicted membrane-bound spermidine synthase
LEFIRQAAGSVLIHGLGLGMAARACLIRPKVTDITIVELEQDVINLVEPWLSEAARKVDKDLTVINDNALTWKPPKGAFWYTVWHDIWTDISEDNLPDMHTLHRKFGRRCVNWQGSWKRPEIERLAKQNQGLYR